jgi:hypothetical protein
MKRYKVTLEALVPVYTYVWVDAENEQDAFDAALAEYNRGNVPYHEFTDGGDPYLMDVGASTAEYISEA